MNFENPRRVDREPGDCIEVDVTSDVIGAHLITGGRALPLDGQVDDMKYSVTMRIPVDRIDTDEELNFDFNNVPQDMFIASEDESLPGTFILKQGVRIMLYAEYEGNDAKGWHSYDHFTPVGRILELIPPADNRN